MKNRKKYFLILDRGAIYPEFIPRETLFSTTSPQQQGDHRGSRVATREIFKARDIYRRCVRKHARFRGERPRISDRMHFPCS